MYLRSERNVDGHPPHIGIASLATESQVVMEEVDGWLSPTRALWAMVDQDHGAHEEEAVDDQGCEARN